MNSYQARPLTALEVTALNGYTHKGVITATNQALNLLFIPKGSKVQVMVEPLVAFKDADTAGTDSTQVEFGDTANGVANELALQQLNENGAEITTTVEGALSGVFAADDMLKATFVPKAGTNLNAIDVGHLAYYVKIINPIPHLNASTPPLTGARK
jgi:hypothetical protein